MHPPDLLVPVRRCARHGGAYAWPAAPVLSAARGEDLRPLGALAAALRREARVRARIVPGVVDGASVRLVRAGKGAAGSYTLRVERHGVTASAATAEGMYYAVQTLRELVRLHGARLPCMDIGDAPDFARRGVYLDCSRGRVPTVETVKALVEYLASLKINELQLYVENVFTFRRHPLIGRGFSPYTPADLLDLQAHARLHHVRFVPSLASFGHVERILALPPYRGLGEKPGHLGYPGGTTLCPLDPRSVRLVADLYDEFLPLFDAVDFNACGDEPWELGQGRSAAAAARRGAGRIYLGFVRKLHRLCERHGKRMNLWTDIVLNHPGLLPELPPGLVLLNWDYDAAGTRIPQTRSLAASRHAFLVCPGTHGWQSHGTRLGAAVANVAVFAAEGRRCGAEGLLNTDWGDFGHRNPLGVSLHGFAHGAAHAWHGAGVDDRRFTERFCRHVFRQDDRRLAAAIRTLGASEERAGASLYRSFEAAVAPGGDAFRGLPRMSPVRVPAAQRRHGFGAYRAAGCERVIAGLEHAGRWKAFAAGLPAFEARAVEDLALAARLDTAAARRVLIGKDLAAGRRPGVRAVRRCAEETDALGVAFEANWRARYRPSRLADNLRVLRRIAGELRALG